MSTLLASEQRAHDLRRDLMHTAKTFGKAARETAKVLHKIQEIQRTESYLKREVTT